VWTSANAHTVSIDQGIGVVPYNGAIEVKPIADTDYTITATNSHGSTSQTIHIKVLDPLPALTLTATPDAVWPGSSVVLSWTCEHTQSCTIDQGIGEVDLNGTLTVTPGVTTTYTLTAKNVEGTSTSKATVTVKRAGITLDSPFEAIEPGGTATLKWTTNDAEDCTIDQGIGTVDLNGTKSLSPTVTTVYTLTCHSHGTTATAPFTVHVNDSTAKPVAQLTAGATAIHQGQSVTLSWYSGNGSEFHIDNGIGKVAYRGTLAVSPAHTTAYTFTVIGPAGVARSEVTVQVLGDPAAQPQGSFGKAYEDLIPADATVEKYEARRFALVKGSVQDIHGQPLAGITVTMLDHPEYGSTVTTTEGEYTLPVEGGAGMTVVYRKAGLLPSQRQVYVPWNDVALIKPVQMIAEDSSSTTVHFDGNADTVVTHRAGVVTDQFGSRAMTMVFRGDNTAYMVDEKGATVKEMPTIVTRATEYSTPQSMPAELPKISAYTYCAELTVDGAQRVRFAKPVVTFVENFLGFAVGQAVPLGYYDRDRGEWIAEPNGLVVKLLDSDSNGVVDGLDKDGDGTADDLNDDGDVHDEVRGLEDAAIYVPGATFWRAEIRHFSPWDWNWCTYESLMNLFGHGKPQVDGQTCKDGSTCVGSSVSNESRIFHEDIGIPGTGFSLSYVSDRTDGYKTRFTVPASGPEIPDDLKRIVVEVDVAGRLLSQTLEAKPNQIAEFLWDGLDFRGQKVDHKVTAHVKIGYVFASVYMESNYLKMSFAEFGTAITQVPTRDEVISWQQSEMIINVAGKGHGLAQGWSISAHHILSPTDPSTLYKGDGSITRNITSVMSTVAGNGEEGWPQTGNQALQTPFTSPVSVVNDSAGDLYVANQIHASVVKIKRDGTVEVLAGGIAGQKEEDGIDAREAQLQMPSDLALDSRGRLYIADAGSCKIRRIDEKGIITTIAGNGTCKSSGDDGPALQAEITPNSLAVDDFGNVYFIESTSCVGGEVDPVTGVCTGGTTVEGSYRVRKVSTNGQIATVVGTGEKYDPNVHTTIGDEGPASAAVLVNPTSLSIDPDGNIYLADGSRIRKINTSGLITTVAGSGASGYSGDGGLAKDARITLASGITFDRSGNFYFSQFYGNGDVVRKVTSNGYISTVAGKGTPGLDGDNGPATHALLKQPNRVAIDPAGFIYIPDRGNHLIRKVSIESYSEKETRFAEENGLGHLISAAGLHLSTYDLKTGVTLLSFGYDTENRLISITDQFGRVTSIVRLGDGTASAIVSPTVCVPS
ncbi:MAG: hypothetical protein Q8R88_13395, partial [Desulfoprunum sp.]|nr:hypothetical protein [Desulfoprunum sp.]